MSLRATRSLARTLVVLALAGGIAGGCGSESESRSTDAGERGSTPGATAFDASFVPGDATRLLVVRTSPAAIDRAREVAERVAGWPVLAPLLPTRTEVVARVVRQVGLGPVEPGSDDWIGDEAGAALLPGMDDGWILWADVRAGEGEAARDAVDDWTRASADADAIEVEQRDGRILVASSKVQLDRAHAAAEDDTAFGDRVEWRQLEAAFARRGATVAVFGHDGGSVVGFDDAGIRLDGAATARRCEDLPAGDAFAALEQRAAGTSIVRASPDGAARDATQLRADRTAVVGFLGELERGASASDTRRALALATPLIAGFDLDLVEDGDYDLTEDSAFLATRDAIGRVPDDASVAWWFDTTRIAHQVVDGLRDAGQLGRAEALIARGAMSGVDGGLLWVRRETVDGTCVSRFSARVAIPTL